MIRRFRGVSVFPCVLEGSSLVNERLTSSGLPMMARNAGNSFGCGVFVFVLRLGAACRESKVIAAWRVLATFRLAPWQRAVEQRRGERGVGALAKSRCWTSRA